MNRLLLGLSAFFLTVYGLAAVSSTLIVIAIAAAGAIAITTLVAPDIGPPLCALIVGTALAIAGFGLIAPYIVCRVGSPYDGNVCPVGKDTRETLQRARIKWAISIALASAGLAWWDLRGLVGTTWRTTKHVWLSNISG